MAHVELITGTTTPAASSAASSTIYDDHDWAYRVKGENIELYELNNEYDYIAPSEDITDGLKIEYMSGGSVFVDSSGFSEDTSPDADSIINARDSIVRAVLLWVRKKVAEDKYSKTNEWKDMQVMNTWDQKFRLEFEKAKDAMNPPPKQCIVQSPYAFRRT